MSSPSKYFILGTQGVSRSDGSVVRGAFDTARAKLYALPESLARALEDSSQELTQAQEAALTAIEVVDQSGTAADYLAHMERESTDLSVRKFVLLPTPACNMGCEYCGQLHKGPSLKQGFLDIIIPRITSVINDAATEEVHVNWFGGEPLLAKAQLFQAAEELQMAAQRRGVAYFSQLTTNGSLFTPELLKDLIERAGITRIDVTVDGPKDVHDASRKMKNGSSTYDRILDSLAAVQHEPWIRKCALIIRTNVTLATLPHVSEYLQDLATRGLSGANSPLLQIAPVHEWGVGTDAYDVSARTFARAEIEWFDLATKFGLRFEPLPQLASEPCSAGRQATETIDPNGFVFDCVQYPLTPRARVSLSLGRRPPEGAAPRESSDLMKDMVWNRPSNGPVCSECPLLPVCGGACALSRSQGRVQCPSMKFNFRERIDVAMRRQFAEAG